MKLVAIDPGIGGAMVVIDENLPIVWCDNPTIQIKSKTMLCPDWITEFLKLHDPIVCVTEHVGASPRMGVSSAFNFGYGAGVIAGVCAGLTLPLYTISPQKWKTYHGLIGKPKDAARLKVIELYPFLAEKFKLKKMVDTADAILMGVAWQQVFMRKTLKGKKK